MKNKNLNDNISRTLDEVISESFGRYAKYIIQDRALPDVRDGLKPVQRRILFKAYQSGLKWTNPHRKSAKLVGEVMGTLHPHGDSSIYEAIVRMCQPWKSSIPLLEMHGNFGSIDGDPAAAMRYTEVRLAPIAELLLAGIEKKTVKFVNNFDDTQQEPTVLPAKLFNLLLNGASGIAAGYATNIPPFNFLEISQVLVQLINKPNTDIEEILKIMPGPDFPTGGIIEGYEGIEQAYKTGKGKIFIRSNYKVVKNKKCDQLIFTDIPFDTNKANIIKEIDELIAKQSLAHVLEVRDESDRDGISIVLDIVPEANVDPIVAFLYKNTDLRISYAMNFVVIDQLKPKLMNMLQLFHAFINHLKTIVLDELKHDHQKLEKDLEITNGLIKATSILDEVIRVIKRSSDKNNAKTNLMQKYNFTENQAEAIVQLRLYRLSNSDIQKLVNEQKELQDNLAKLDALINNETLFKNHLKNFINTSCKNYGVDRKSKISQELTNINVSEENLVEFKEMMYSFTQNHSLKLLEYKKLTLNDLKNNYIRQDDFYNDFNVVNNKDVFLFTTNIGNFFSLPVYKCEVKKTSMLGQSINSLLSLQPNEVVVNCHPISLINTNDQSAILLTTKNGLTKKVYVNQLLKVNAKKGATLIKLNPNDALASSIVINHLNSSVAYFTNKGMVNHALVSSVNFLSRNSSGHRCIKLKDDDYIITTLEVPVNNHLHLMLWQNGFYKQIVWKNIEINKLSSTGIKLFPKKSNVNLKTAFFVTDKDHIWIKNADLKNELLSFNQFKTTSISSDLMPINYLEINKETLLAEKLKYEKNKLDVEVVKLF